MIFPDLIMVKVSCVCDCVLSSSLSFCVFPLCFISPGCSVFLWFGGCVFFSIISFPSILKFLKCSCWFTKQGGLWVCWVYPLLLVCLLSTSSFWRSLWLILGDPHVYLCPGDYVSSLHHSYFVTSSLEVIWSMDNYGSLYPQSSIFLLHHYSWSCR